MFLISLLVLLLLVGAIAFLLPRLEREWRNYFFNRVIWRNRLNRKEFLQFDAFLSERMTYYRNLNVEGRARFLYRTLQFLESWTFEGRKGIEIDLHKRLLICASAAQLTYGHTYYKIPTFTKVILYPDIFYSKLAEADVKGLTYGTGQVALSWNYFEEGYRIDSDGINLGLHEMAHALDVNQMRHGSTDDIISLYFGTFVEQGFRQIKRLDGSGNAHLRARALENPNEFFAVCVENFFEAPEAFRENLPDIFLSLCALLQQNPLNITNNYELDARFIDEANRSSERRIPMAFKYVKKGITSGTLTLLTLNLLPAIIIWIHLLNLNRDQVTTLNLTLLAGGALFMFIREGVGLLINSSGRMMWSVFAWVRGAGLTVSLLFLLSTTLFFHEEEKSYRVMNPDCQRNPCRLRLSGQSDLPDRFSFPYQYPGYQEYRMFPEHSVDEVYLNERQKLGMFNLRYGYSYMELETANRHFPNRDYVPGLK